MWLKTGVTATVLLILGFVGIVAMMLAHWPPLYLRLVGVFCLAMLAVMWIAIRKFSASEDDVLRALADGEPTSIEVVKRVSEMTGRKRIISFGRLYPMLLRFEGQGVVESRWGVVTPERGGNRP